MKIEGELIAGVGALFTIVIYIVVAWAKEVGESL